MALTTTLCATYPSFKPEHMSKTQRGPIILIVNHSAHMPDGKTILSPGQMEHFKWAVTDKSPVCSPAAPMLTSPEGYVFPLSIRQGLAYLSTRPYTDSEWNTLPRVVATSPLPWDPACLDYTIPDTWSENIPPPDLSLRDDYGEVDRLLKDPEPSAFQCASVNRSTIKAYATSSSKMNSMRLVLHTMLRDSNNAKPAARHTLPAVVPSL